VRNLHLDYENRPRTYGLSPDQRERLVELHFERGAERQLYADAKLAAALALGAQFRALKEQG